MVLSGEAEKSGSYKVEIQSTDMIFLVSLFFLLPQVLGHLKILGIYDHR